MTSLGVHAASREQTQNRILTHSSCARIGKRLCLSENGQKCHFPDHGQVYSRPACLSSPHDIYQTGGEALLSPHVWLEWVNPPGT